MTYQETLQTALELQLSGSDLEDFLSQVPGWRLELEADLQLAALLRNQISKVQPSSEASKRASGLLRTTIEERSQIEPSHRSWIFFLPIRRTPVRLALSAGITAALLLLFGLIFALPGGNPLTTTTAEAVMIEGTVSEISPVGLLLTSGNTQETVLIQDGAVLQDSFGNIVSVRRLKPGQTVVLTGNHSNGEFLASQVEFKDKLFGTILTLDADRIELVGGERRFTVLLSPDTRIEGALAIGVFVEIEVLQLSDGTLLAEEVEVEEDGADDDDKGGGRSSGDEDEDRTPASFGDASETSTTSRVLLSGDDDEEQPQETQYPESAQKAEETQELEPSEEHD